MRVPGRGAGTEAFENLGWSAPMALSSTRAAPSAPATANLPHASKRRVTWPTAETTTSGLESACAATIEAARSRQPASCSEVPPNFMTITPTPLRPLRHQTGCSKIRESPLASPPTTPPQVFQGPVLRLQKCLPSHPAAAPFAPSSRRRTVARAQWPGMTTLRLIRALGVDDCARVGSAGSQRSVQLVQNAP